MIHINNDVNDSPLHPTHCIQRLERELRDTRLKEAQLQDEAEQVQHSVSAILQRREQLQLTCGDYTNTLRSGKSARERAAEELNRVNAQIEVVEQRLAELKPEYKAARQKEDDLANALSDAEHRRLVFCLFVII